MSLISRGFGSDGNDSTLMLAGWSQSSTFTPTYEALLTLGFGIDSDQAALIRLGFSPYVGLPAAPGVANQYTDVTALPVPGQISVLQGESPSSVGDVMLEPFTTSKQGYTLTINGDGSFIINAGGDTTVEYFSANIFHVAAQSFDGAYTVYVDDPGPQLVSPIPEIFSPIGTPISLDFVAGGYVSDPIGAGLTSSIVSGSLPAGVTLVGTLISGTAGAFFTSTLTVNLTDAAGESLQVSVVILIYGQISVPNVIDLSQAAAAALLSANGLVGIFNSPTAFSNTVPFGYVLTQSFAAGTLVNQGATISMGLSLGPAIYPGPNITLGAALAILANAGFVPYPVLQYVYSSTVPDGYVVAQSPPAGTMITSSQGVQLTVSMGPPNAVVTSTIPNVVGLKFLDAQNKLVAAQCSVANVTWQISNSVGIARVISQSPVAGGPVTEWTQVSLVVASGPTVTYPNTGALTVPNVVTP